MAKQQTINLAELRHSLAHILAAAVKELYPFVKFAIGPAIDNGFYYDFDFGSESISVADLIKIEKKMKEIMSRNLVFEHRELPVKEALALVKKAKQPYKEELIKELAAAGETKVGFYKLGEFDDLCRGPHLESSGKINQDAFKLHKVAGAYWRGDEANTMLTRIYGLAFSSKQELAEYIKMMEEAAKRDHRKLGQELGLFVFSEMVGKGLPMLTAKGATIRRELERFIVDEEIRRGYQHVITPDLARLELYKKSGHYPYYQDSMYAPIKIDEEEFMLRPMACPHHFELYLSQPHSYRDLPLRIAELAKLYRYEQSGELTGLIRARVFCLADAHIICADATQAKSEVAGVLDLIDYVSTALGLDKGENYVYRLSLGDRTDEKKYFKNDAAWDEAEAVLRAVLSERGDQFVEAAGEAAFYGPKIDVQMTNVAGKEETAFTVQYDFVMPERFNLTYIASDGSEKRGIVIHRSSIGALERVLAFLIEHYAGAFPIWLAPVQVKLLAVGEKHHEFVSKLAQEFSARGLRAEADLSDETVGNKTRKALNEKVPYILVIGDKEMSSSNLNIRDRGAKEIREVGKEEFIKEVLEKIKKRI
jgi:threonyl-tRNA synthetase